MDVLNHLVRVPDGVTLAGDGGRKTAGRKIYAE